MTLSPPIEQSVERDDMSCDHDHDYEDDDDSDVQMDTTHLEDKVGDEGVSQFRIQLE